MEQIEHKEKQVLELIQESGLPLDIRERLVSCLRYSINLVGPSHNVYVLWGRQSDEEWRNTALWDTTGCSGSQRLHPGLSHMAVFVTPFFDRSVPQISLNVDIQI
jgi:hypothetical protein